MSFQSIEDDDELLSLLLFKFKFYNSSSKYSKIEVFWSFKLEVNFPKETLVL